MLFRVAPTRYLPANKYILRQGCLHLRPILPRQMPACKKHNLWKERLHCRVVAYNGHMCKEATDRGTIRQLFRQVLYLFPAPPLDDVAPNVCEFKRHCRFAKVQQQGHVASGPCILAQPLAPLPGQCCPVRWCGWGDYVSQVPPVEHSSTPRGLHTTLPYPRVPL